MTTTMWAFIGLNILHILWHVFLALVGVAFLRRLFGHTRFWQVRVEPLIERCSFRWPWSSSPCCSEKKCTKD